MKRCAPKGYMRAGSWRSTPNILLIDADDYQIKKLRADRLRYPTEKSI